MKIRAAVLDEMGRPGPYVQTRPVAIETIELDAPGPGEVLVRITAAGLCHSDLSIINGDRPRVMPMVLGHEAAGVVEEVGPGITHLQRGDHVVAAFVPSCGHCIPCATGRPALCEPGFRANTAGTLLSGERRLHDSHGTVNHHLGVSGFAQYAVLAANSLVKVPSDLPFAEAALFGCAVITGVGAVVNTAAMPHGASVAVDGLGGVGLAALLRRREGGFPRFEFMPDISNLYPTADRLWVATSTDDKAKGRLIDVFDKDGRFIDSFYLGARRTLMAVRDGSVFCQEKNEDETITIVKYGIVK